MKNFIQKVAIYGVLLVGLSMACDNSLESTYEDFAEEGETTYIGRADTVLLGHGFNKLRFGIVINSDPKISKGLIKTNNEDIYHEFDVVRANNGADTTTFDLDIPEGEYTLGVFLMDENDNTSVRREVSAQVYGESYQNGLINRDVVGVDAFAETALIHWSDAFPGTVNTLLIYEDAAGAEQTIEVPNEETDTEIPNYRVGGDIQVSSIYEPTPTAIEVFEATPSEMSFPEEYLLDKSMISALQLTGDAGEGCFGSTYARLFDGATDEFWHSCDEQDDLYPFVMSFDLGTETALAKFRIDERGSNGERSPQAFQIWGTNTIEGAETINLSENGLETWEADAEAQGWVKLLEVNDNGDTTFEGEIPESGNQYRYVRFVGISSINGETTANFNEFTFWGN